jgi:hypothetical protein
MSVISKSLQTVRYSHIQPINVEGNITAEFACLKHITNTIPHVLLVLGNSDNWEVTEGSNIYIGHLHLVELIAEFSKLLGYKNHRKGKWEVCEDSDSSTD